MKYLQPPSLQLHAGTNCHTWRSDNPQHLFEGKNKFAAETTARAKKEKKASLEKNCVPCLINPWDFTRQDAIHSYHTGWGYPQRRSRPGMLSASPRQSIKSKSLPQPQTSDRARKAASDWLGSPASVSWRAFPGRVEGDSEHPIQHRDASCFARIVSSTTNT